MLLGRTGSELPFNSNLFDWHSRGGAGRTSECICVILRAEAALLSQKVLDCSTVFKQHSPRHGVRKRTPYRCARERKYKSPATKAAEEAIARLEPPLFPEYLRGDDGDGPSGSEEENDAERLRSASTVLRSARGLETDEYDRVT